VNQFVTWRLALGSNFSLNCQHNSIFSFLRFQAGRTISTNFALREVSAAAYDEQQTHFQLIAVVVDHGLWQMDFNNNKNRLKNIETPLFSLRSI
jgi:hypothetical protein